MLILNAQLYKRTHEFIVDFIVGMICRLIIKTEVYILSENIHCSYHSRLAIYVSTIIVIVRGSWKSQ